MRFVYQHIMPKRGFTLIEGIIALGIISTTLVIGLSLAISNLTAGQDNSDRVIADNLAREGLELVRDNRDTNWVRKMANLSPNNWDYNPNGGGTALYGYVDPDITWPSGYFTFGNGYFQLLPAVANGGSYDLISCMQAGNVAAAIGCQVKKYSLGNWRMYYQYSADLTKPPYNQSGVKDTRFFRRLLLEPICWTGTTEYVSQIAGTDAPATWGTCKSGGSVIGVSVTSQVVWLRATKILEASAKERMYDWHSGTYATSTGVLLQ